MLSIPRPDINFRIPPNFYPQGQSSSVGLVLMTNKVDKNVRRSHQRINCQTQSLHYCHSCAVKNRVDNSGLSDKPAAAEISVNAFMPNDDNLKQLNDMEIRIQRLKVFATCI